MAKNPLDDLAEEAVLAEARKREAKESSLKAKLKEEAAKRRQAECELAELEGRFEVLLGGADRKNLKKLETLKSRKRKGSATGIICCNDWHAEESVDPEVVNGMNEFNLEIADRRIQRMWNKAEYLVEFARNISDIDDLVVWLGGDLINGAIHEELEESNFLGPAEAILWVQERVAMGLEKLSKLKQIKSIRVVTSYGNHGRSTRKRRISTGYRHSWEWLSYNNLAKWFSAEKKIAFQVAKGYHNWVNVQGYDVRFHHGDAVRFGGGVGGPSIPLNKKIGAWNKQRKAHLDVLGHFHQTLVGPQYVMCGCLVGHNAYAIEIGAEYELPHQTFIVMDKDYGRVMSLPIWVEAHT